MVHAAPRQYVFTRCAELQNMGFFWYRHFCVARKKCDDELEQKDQFTSEPEEHSVERKSVTRVFAALNEPLTRETKYICCGMMLIVRNSRSCVHDKL